MESLTQYEAKLGHNLWPWIFVSICRVYNEIVFNNDIPLQFHCLNIVVKDVSHPMISFGYRHRPTLSEIGYWLP